MDENFNSTEKSSLGLLNHELFLVFRFLTFGLALLLTISLFFYTRLVLIEGPWMFGAKVLPEQRRLPAATDSEDENIAL
jgi:hypothetical protein